MKTPDVKLDKDPAALLTPREGEILVALAQGYPNKAIAAELEISVKTVDTHRGKLLKKLGLRNNADLARCAIRHGLIDADGNELARVPRAPVEPFGQPRSAIAQVEARR